VRGLIDGGCDILLAETVFDTLTLQGLPVRRRGGLCREETWPCQSCCQEPSRQERPPDVGPKPSTRSTPPSSTRGLGRSVSTAGAGRPQLRPYIEGTWPGKPMNTSCANPMRGCPMLFGGYDEQPADTATLVGELAPAGLVNIVGGCCGTTPDHIARSRSPCKGVSPLRAAGTAGAALASGWAGHADRPA